MAERTLKEREGALPGIKNALLQSLNGEPLCGTALNSYKDRPGRPRDPETDPNTQENLIYDKSDVANH